MDRLSWRAGFGDIEDWLGEIFDRFAVSPEEFTLRGGEKTPRYDGPPNGRPYDQEVSHTSAGRFPRETTASVIIEARLA